MPMPTWDGSPVSPDHVRRAAAICHDTLAPALEADWSIPAGPLTWTCRETLDHITDALKQHQRSARPDDDQTIIAMQIGGAI